MIKTTCIDHINMYVLDMQQTKDWYTRVFGFEEYDDNIIGNKDIKLCLLKTNDLIRHGCSIDHFGFHVQDYDTTLQYLIEIGVPLENEMHWEFSRSAYIKDPNGYRIELSEYKGGGFDLPDEIKQVKLRSFLTMESKMNTHDNGGLFLGFDCDF